MLLTAVGTAEMNTIVKVRLDGCQRGNIVLQGKREAVIAVYEAKPLISDHKVANGMGPLHDIS